MKSRTRERVSPLAGCVVRCVCACASLVATGCALLGLGLACALLPRLDPASGACPRPMAVGAFAAAGALLAAGLALAALACRRSRKALGLPPEDPPDAPHYKKKLSSEDTGVPSNVEPLTKDDAFEMTQISAEVSQWIEQQEDSALPAPSESFCLEIAAPQAEQETSDGEMTAL